MLDLFRNLSSSRGKSNMDPEIFEIMVAVLMVAVSVILVMWVRRNMATASERRMKGMMKWIGLDPKIVTHGDTETIIKEARRRCSKCQNEDVCERWLLGRVKSDNNFYPNAEAFRILRDTTRLTAWYVRSDGEWRIGSTAITQLQQYSSAVPSGKPCESTDNYFNSWTLPGRCNHLTHGLKLPVSAIRFCPSPTSQKL